MHLYASFVEVGEDFGGVPDGGGLGDQEEAVAHGLPFLLALGVGGGWVEVAVDVDPAGWGGD